jgi:hypothetical protein
MLKDRLDNYKKLEEMRNSKLLVYVTSDRRGLETTVATDILAPFSKQLDKIGDVDKISLFLYTRGGATLAAWSLVNLIRSFCKDLEIIVPYNCHSAGTLICLGANRIVMTKQATLGPIDPSTNGLMNPQIDFNNQKIRVPVSVEQINGYLGMARNELGIKNQKHLKDVLVNLADKIHPLSLGEVYRSKSQIQMLAKKLLKNQNLSQNEEKKVINFLCSESGSHDYTIYRKEAKEDLGLKIEVPTKELYNLVNGIYLDIEKELELLNPYDPKILLATSNPFTYSFRRALIESIDGGCDVFISEGTLTLVNLNIPGAGPQVALQDNRTFDRWRHENINLN